MPLVRREKRDIVCEEFPVEGRPDLLAGKRRFALKLRAYLSGDRYDGRRSRLKERDDGW